MISFHANLSPTIATTNAQTIVFDHVTTNLGGAYNGTTGVFTAPVAGQYYFSLTFMLNNPSSDYSYFGKLDVIKNRNIVILVRADANPETGHFATASGATIIGLIKGDKVSVEANSAQMIIIGGEYTYFSGFMLG